MKIQTGSEMMKNVKPIEGNGVDFMIDGRRVFSVEIGKDGRSLEIRACDTYKVNGVLYGPSIVIAPNVTNSITLSTKPWDS